MSEASIKRPEIWLNRKQTAEYLTRGGCPLSCVSLANMAARGGGPPYVRISKKIIRYEKGEVRDWANATVRRFVP